MANTVTCRYCGDQFTPKPGKPGFIDECPECLHDKTTPKTPPIKSISPEALERIKLLDKTLSFYKRKWIKAGLSQEKIDQNFSTLIKLLTGND